MFAVVVFLGTSLYLSKEKQSYLNDNSSNAKINKKYSELKIGYITDLHCYSKFEEDENKWEVNWRCSDPMGNFTKIMNGEFFPDVVVDGGDLIDGRDGQGENLYPAVLSIFDDIKVPHYHIIGNHETRNFTKDTWREFTGYEENYYYQDINDHRLIFLDGNNKPDSEKGSVDTTPDLESYPGFLGKDQIDWLKGVLGKSQGKNILVFVHQPPLEKTVLKETKELFLNGEEVRNLFSKYGVSAVFSGHIEEMCFIKDNGVEYYALEGVHKDNRQLLEEDDYKDKGVFYEITINEQGKPEVKMFYKDRGVIEYETLIVNSDTALCNNQSIENPQAYKDLVDTAEEQEEENENQDDN